MGTKKTGCLYGRDPDAMRKMPKLKLLLAEAMRLQAVVKAAQPSGLPDRYEYAIEDLVNWLKANSGS